MSYLRFSGEKKVINNFENKIIELYLHTQ